MPKRQYDRASTVLQTVLETMANAAGRRSGFVARESKVTAARFVQMLVLGCLGQAEATLGDMVEVGEELGVSVTKPGLNQRIDAEAVALLREVLGCALAEGVGERADACALFARFSAVYLQDSTYFSLPAALAEQWRGCGGNASPAGAKVWLNYEYLSGTIAALEVGEGCVADQGCRLTQTLATPTSLHLFDLGFYAIDALAELAAGGSYFVCRHQSQSALYTSSDDAERIDLEALLDACADDTCEFEALLGDKQRLPVRILCQRLPDDVVALRRARAQARARKSRRKLSARTLKLMAWNIFCTNVPADWWSLAQVLAVYRLRWQIELLFKLWKSQAGLDRFGNWRAERVLCQLYARLIALVLAQRLLGPLRFSGPRELSLPKAFRILQRMTLSLIEAIADGWLTLHRLLQRLERRCHRLALTDQRRKKPSTYQTLSTLEV